MRLIKVLKAHFICLKVKVNISSWAIAVLGYDYLCGMWFFGVLRMIILIAIYEHNYVGILFN